MPHSFSYQALGGTAATSAIDATAGSLYAIIFTGDLIVGSTGLTFHNGASAAGPIIVRFQQKILLEDEPIAVIVDATYVTGLFMDWAGGGTGKHAEFTVLYDT
jgi:hypothetical protein